MKTAPTPSHAKHPARVHHGPPSAAVAQRYAVPVEIVRRNLPVAEAEPLIGPAETTQRPLVSFRYLEPEAREVYLVGSFNNWQPAATPMIRNDDNDWAVELELVPGEYRYRLLVDGEWRDDPAAQQFVANPFGGVDALIIVT